MSAATERAPIHVSREIHQQIKIAAATEGVSMQSLTERLLRLGMAESEATDVLWRGCMNAACAETIEVARSTLLQHLKAYDEIMAEAEQAAEGDPNA